MSSNEIAFFIGLFGSLHCVGMCGPLAFAIPSFGQSRWRIVVDKLLYNSGRVITYTLLGFIAGMVGRQLWLANLQQALSLVTGLIIIAVGISRIFKWRLLPGNGNKAFFSPVNRMLNYALKHQAGHLAVGLLNGFLPCGFVYLALLGAINTPSPVTASQYMFWFGVGTFPLMLLATISAGFAGPAVRRKINVFLPYLMVCLGLWFILRGAGLDIPYLSPARNPDGSICY